MAEEIEALIDANELFSKALIETKEAIAAAQQKQQKVIQVSEYWILVDVSVAYRLKMNYYRERPHDWLFSNLQLYLFIINGFRIVLSETIHSKL